MQRHIIYVPGLGDGYDIIRKAGLLLWRGRKTRVTLVPMHWMNNDDTHEDKLARIKTAVNAYSDSEIVIVGESAGGAMAIVASRRFLPKTGKVATICGMNRGAGSVSPLLYEKNKAFRTTMREADTVTPTLRADEKQRMLVLYSSRDGVVQPQHTLISGAQSHDLRIPGHQTSVLSVLLYYYRLIKKF